MPYPQTNVTAFTGIDIPTRADPANWNERSEDGWARLEPGGDQFNVLAGQVNVMADAANASASAADQAKADAQQARTDAQAARGGAESARDAAQAARGAAETARDAAQAYLDALTATSTTPLVIGAGNKTFTGAGLAGKQFKIGQTLKAVNPGNVAQWMAGPVTAYTSNGASSSLTLAVADVSPTAGGNTVANWNIVVGGEKGGAGPTGGVNGGSLAGALWEKKGADLPSSASPDVWSAGGNYFSITGNATITGLPDAPQPGAQFRALVTGTPSISPGANLIVPGVPSGATYRLSPGDTLFGVADTPTTFRVIIVRADGSSVTASLPFTFAEQITISGPFIPRVTGWHFITLLGAGGRGFAGNGNNSNAYFHGVGGGSGALCRGWRYLTAGQAYMVSLGARAPSVGVASGASTPGADGGDTTFSGTGITTMTAGGGKGGTGMNRPGQIAVSVPGAAGGIASGGDENINGAASGGVSIAVGVQTVVAAATGGAAPGIRGVGYGSGAAALTGTAGAGAAVATGGASIGGASGSATSGTQSAVTSFGAGAYGPSNTQLGGINFAGVPSGPAASFYQSPAPVLLNATAGGEAINTPDGERPGGSASGGRAGNGTAQSAVAGAFAGSGGAASTGGSGVSGDAGYGAGSGAAIAAASTCTAGAGGAAFVLIQR